MLSSGIFQEIDEKRVRRLRDTSAAVGRAYHDAVIKNDKRRGYEMAMIAATYFRRAAADSILLGEIYQSAELFGEAAQHYQNAGSPYAAYMGALAGRHMPDYSKRDLKPSAQSVYALLSGLGGEENSQSSARMLREELEEFRGRPVGVLAVPVDQYLDLFDAVQKTIHIDDASPTLLRNSLIPFLYTYSAALRRARRDKYHWSRLAMVFHPVEPDAVGIFVVVAARLAKAGIDLKTMLEDLPVDRETMAVIAYCVKNMIRSLKDGKERDEE